MYELLYANRIIKLLIGKRPRDLLNPKALKYMQAVFSIKDGITKKESREIGALFGLTVTQVLPVCCYRWNGFMHLV